ncbi:MAG TPA: AI-2E family transporter, partial [Candidatus Saccharimonadales bacterium]|nr:AI-2E family transporter [Candidatus Saccharimonadales bacterium]
FATTLSFLIVVILIGGFLASIVPPLVKQTDNFIKAAPHLISEFRNQNSPIGSFIRHNHLQKEVNSISNQLSNKLGNIGGTALTTAEAITSSIFSVVVILVMTFMMLVEGPRWLSFFRSTMPEKHHPIADRMLKDMYAVIRGYVNGQVLLAVIASICLAPALFLLHIGYPAGLVVVIFICALIPMIGHTIGAIIVTSVALFHSTTSAAIMLAYYIIYMQIEAYIIQPRIQSNTTNMSPLLVFISVTIGVNYSGILGGLLAIPIAGCLRIAFLEYLRSKRVIDNKEFETVTSVETR